LFLLEKGKLVMNRFKKILLGFTGLFLISCSIQSNFIKRDLQDIEHDFLREENKLWSLLSDEVKQSGKTINLTMPDIQQPTWVQVHAASPERLIPQTFVLTQHNQSVTLQIPEPSHIYDKISVVMKPAVVVAAFKNFQKSSHALDDYGAKLTPQELKELDTLAERMDAAPTNVLTFQYSKLQNNETIKLPYPAKDRPTVNSDNDRIIQNMDGALFKSLPKSVQHSGKKIHLKLVGSHQSFSATISGTIASRPELGVVSQVVVFSPKHTTHTIHIPEPIINDPRKSAAIDIRLRLHDVVTRQSRFLKKNSKYLYNLNTKEKQERDAINDEHFRTPMAYKSYEYADLKDNQTIVLQCPTKSLSEQVKSEEFRKGFMQND
jgi:hypothetical protein